MKILGIDYGAVRTGIALCDESEFLASPLCCITESYAPKLAKKIAETVAKTGAQMLVLGLPKNMDGTCGFRCEQCESLASLLQIETGLIPVFVDERLTTVSAHKALSFDGVSAKKRKDIVDMLSAVMILQSYLDGKK